MKWPKKCNSIEFDETCAKYDISDIEDIKVTPIQNVLGKVFVSPFRRSVLTGKRLFADKDLHEIKSIAEVPIKSFIDTDRAYPLWVWNVMGRVQWYFNNDRQMESRLDTYRRADETINICEAEAVDCTLVTHGFFIKSLLKVLKNRGYRLRGNKSIKIKNLQVIVAEK